MQPQQGQMVQGFSDPQAAAQPTMVGGQYVLTVPQQSPAPTWMGVIMILWGLIFGLLGGLLFFPTPDFTKSLLVGILLPSNFFPDFVSQSLLFCSFITATFLPIIGLKINFPYRK